MKEHNLLYEFDVYRRERYIRSYFEHSYIKYFPYFFGRGCLNHFASLWLRIINKMNKRRKTLPGLNWWMFYFIIYTEMALSPTASVDWVLGGALMVMAVHTSSSSCNNVFKIPRFTSVRADLVTLCSRIRSTKASF